MTHYTKDELISSSELAKNINKVLTTLKKNQHKKLAIIHNNRPEAVLIPIGEYEKLLEAFELLEHADIYRAIKNRLSTPTEDYLSHDELLVQLNNE
jgi:PHD/YefM family antitoxin component YafN of YafNO toxin-antitoxin module